MLDPRGQLLRAAVGFAGYSCPRTTVRCTCSKRGSTSRGEVLNDLDSRDPRTLESRPWAKPVTFPPGRARLATSPSATGSGLTAKTIGISRVCMLGRDGRCRITGHDDVKLELNQLGRKSRQAPVCPSSQRYSKIMFASSAYPSSRSPSRNARKPLDASRDARLSTPTGTPSPLAAPRPRAAQRAHQA